MIKDVRSAVPGMARRRSDRHHLQMEFWSPPVLRWAGSKRSLLPQLLPHARHARGRYVEPFAGSACLFFAARPHSAVLGDLNGELIETYGVLRQHPRLVARRMHAWPTDADGYYAVRNLAPTQLGPIERAARFIYLNRLCFNGVYRTNRKGQFNVPYGKHTGAPPTEQHLYRCSVALRGADLRSGDFDETTADAGPGDFVYLDPPYTQNPETAYGVYGYGSFDARDLDRMMKTLRRLDRKGATFLFSYALVPGLADELPRGWRYREVAARGRVAASVSSRGARPEILVTNRTGTDGHA